MMSSRDERHSLLATLWFTIAHYALRPWPWILVALASLVLYPELGADEKKAGFIMAMKDHLPPGLLGLLVAAFLAAYMSTISTHLNWGSSYIINDLYRRFVRPRAEEKHYVFVSRISILALVVLSSLLVLVINSISGAWAFIIECGAGLGLVLILRWFWWRINAWSEITAMIVPFAGYALSRFVFNIQFPDSLFFIVALTTVSWFAVTFITAPTDKMKLKEFYLRVRPAGPGWNILRDDPDCIEAARRQNERLSGMFLNWIIGIALVYASLFSIGRIIFRDYTSGFILLGSAVALFIVLNVRLKDN